MPVTFNVEVPVEDLKAPEIGHGGYQGLNPRTEVLPKGHQTAPGRRALPCDIQIDHDVAIKVRDGCTLYADIYTPPNAPSRSVPAILCWSPFGKKFNGIDSLRLMTTWNLGIPDGTLSGLEKFEAPDPAEFVPHGYAIVNVDSRGAFDSEGCMAIMGTQEAQDGYDVIEWLAQQEWCNGSVGMAGNSHLAIIQWFIAALQPPSLKAIAPWEGCGDLYREQFARGGIYGGDLFDHLIVKYMLRGRNGMERQATRYEENQHSYVYYCHLYEHNARNGESPWMARGSI
jgi:putative CocE/NonD family hydrolase